MKRAFVAGATGYTGKELIGQLRRAGLDVVAHIRPSSPSFERSKTEFEALGARVCAVEWDQEAFFKAFADLQPSHVFALLGTTKKKGKEEKARGERATYETVDYELTAMLMRAALSSGTCQRFIYLSSLGVSAGSKSAYLRVRWKMETELRASGLNYTIARPSLISGEDREENRPMERVGAWVSRGLLGGLSFLGATGLRDRYQTVNATTLASGLHQAALNPRFSESILHTEDLVALSQSTS